MARRQRINGCQGTEAVAASRKRADAGGGFADLASLRRRRACTNAYEHLSVVRSRPSVSKSA